MKRLLCLIGIHDWLLNSESVMRPNCHRVCRRCDREEVVVAHKTKVIWGEYKTDSTREVLEDAVSHLKSH